MKIKVIKKKFKVKELFEGFVDKIWDGVYAYNNKLNIRPKFQREFIYDLKRQSDIIDSILSDISLGEIYWIKRENGKKYDMLDGQQRFLSIMYYVDNRNSFKIESIGKELKFVNLPKELQNKILEYELNINICEGEWSNFLKLFERLNVQGEPQTEQEIRNFIFSGKWLDDAKRFFLNEGYSIGSDYLKGDHRRQLFLETALKWHSEIEFPNIKDPKRRINEYMSKHQNDSNAINLTNYYQNVINWTKKLFKEYTKYMKGIEWGYLYNRYSERDFDTEKLQKEINELMMDDDVTNKKGIYYYIFDRDPKHLNIRRFTNAMKISVYKKQKGKCKKCGKKFDIKDMEADHIVPWSEGGKTILENCQILCKNCNRKKSNK